MRKSSYNIQRLVLFLEFFSIGFCHSAVPGQDDDYIQNVKSVFIYNFTKYINWIDQDSSSTFNIAVIGESQIMGPLEQIAQKRRVNQRDIKIKHFENVNQIDDCQILFIPEAEKMRFKSIVDRIQGRNILIVSEIDGALSAGVMINFLIAQETIKFEINLQAMKKSNFQPSSQLLKLAVRIVE